MLFGLQFQRVGGFGVLELRMVGVSEVGVAIQGDLAVQGQDLIIGGAHQWVDLDEGGIFFDEDLPQLGDGHRGRVEHLGGQVALLGDLAGEGHVDTLDRVDRDLGEPVGLGGGHLFDLHTALHRAHRQIGPVGTVEQEGEVVLLGDVTGLGHQKFLDDMAFDVQSQDVRGVGVGVVSRRGVLHATSLAAPPGLDLRFHHDRSADFLRDRFGVVCGGGYSAGGGGDMVLGEQFLRLVLEKVHEICAGLSTRSEV